MEVKSFTMKEKIARWLRVLYKEPEHHKYTYKLFGAFILIIPISSAIYLYDELLTPNRSELKILSAVLYTAPARSSKERRIELVSESNRVAIKGMCSTLVPDEANIKSGEKVLAWLSDDVAYQISNINGVVLKPARARFECDLSTTFESFALRKKISWFFMLGSLVAAVCLGARIYIVQKKGI